MDVEQPAVSSAKRPLEAEVRHEYAERPEVDGGVVPIDARSKTYTGAQIYWIDQHEDREVIRRVQAG